MFFRAGAPSLWIICAVAWWGTVAGLIAVLAAQARYRCASGDAALRLNRAREGRRFAGWTLATLALLFQALSSTLFLTSPSSTQFFSTSLQFLCPFLVLGAVLILGERRRIGLHTILSGLDALVISGSALAFLWWFRFETILGHQVTPKISAAFYERSLHDRWFALFLCSVYGAVVVTLASQIYARKIAALRKEQSADATTRARLFSPALWKPASPGVPRRFFLVLGSAVLAIWHLKIVTSPVSPTPELHLLVFLLALVLLALAPTSEALASRFGAASSDVNKTDTPPIVTAENAARADSSSALSDESLPAIRISDILMFALPCLVTLVGAWHLGHSAHTGPLRVIHTNMGYGLAEGWWGLWLLAIAVLRLAALFRRNNYRARVLHARNTALHQELSARTHQLATLHAVAADVNNALSREHVLSTALERVLEAARAQAGAVWLCNDATCQWNETPAPVVNPKRRQKDNFAPNREEKNVRPPRWQMVREEDADGSAQSIFEYMTHALERGGLAACAQIGVARSELSGMIHIAPLSWKGEIMGVFAVLRSAQEESIETPPLSSAERALLDSIGMEVGAALQNAQLYQDARRRAELDDVTNLLNHRTVQERLSALLHRLRGTDRVLTIVVMDLNNFKFFNDVYGHIVGDTILRTVARCLREICRSEDIIGRYGGDEFIAVFPDTDAAGALEVCQRIASRLEQEGYVGATDDDERRIPISLSFGGAIFPQDGTGALELLTVADANLYEAKCGGAPLMIQRNAAEEAQELKQLKDVGVGGSFGVLDALVTAIDNKDRYTRRHSEDVAHWATLMAKQLGYSPETQRAVRISGILHDVGKIAVPDHILRKPGRLTDEEFSILQQHPQFGALIVKDVPNLEEVLGGIRHHHERYDGKGYPDNLQGKDIPMLGRLLAVPDCFSAMTTDRPYRKALSWLEAMEEIEGGKGVQFDPEMADAFLEVMAKIIADQNSRSLDSDGKRHSVAQLGAASTTLSHDPEMLGLPKDSSSPIVNAYADAATENDQKDEAPEQDSSPDTTSSPITKLLSDPTPMLGLPPLDGVTKNDNDSDAAKETPEEKLETTRTASSLMEL